VWRHHRDAARHHADAGLLAILRMEISLPTVAAFLTIVGYSLNDTIVIFDRVRENLHTAKRQNFIAVLNRSINETLPRTVLTSGTTLVTLFSLYLFGGVVIRDFALILIVGVLLGTYSSIFVAAPALLEIEKRFPHEQKQPVSGPRVSRAAHRDQPRASEPGHRPRTTGPPRVMHGGPAFADHVRFALSPDRRRFADDLMPCSSAPGTPASRASSPSRPTPTTPKPPTPCRRPAHPLHRRRAPPRRRCRPDDARPASAILWLDPASSPSARPASTTTTTTRRGMCSAAVFELAPPARPRTATCPSSSIPAPPTTTPPP
jgi:hypothetical protein